MLKYGLQDGQVCDDDPSYREYTILIPQGNYVNPKHLVEEIQYALDLLLKDLLRQGNAAIDFIY